MARRGFRLRRCHRRAPSDSPESLRLANTRQARRAVEDGQYNKTLSSAGVAQATDDVIAEMLAKHPQAGPPSIPSDPAVPAPPHL